MLDDEADDEPPLLDAPWLEDPPPDAPRLPPNETRALPLFVETMRLPLPLPLKWKTEPGRAAPAGFSRLP